VGLQKEHALNEVHTHQQTEVLGECAACLEGGCVVALVEACGVPSAAL